MIRILLAAPALACVCSPASAASACITDSWADLRVATGFAAICFLAIAVWLVFEHFRVKRERRGWGQMLRRSTPVAMGVVLLVGFGLHPALADVIAATATTPVVVTTASLPWGDWLVAALAPISAVLVPLAAGAVTAGVAKVAPWAASVLTRQRVEAAIQAGAAYGQNAIAGVAKGKTIELPLGSSVVATGAQHVIDEAPQLIGKAGGVEGIAKRIFRALPLEEGASVENTLAPAVMQLKAANPGK